MTFLIKAASRVGQDFIDNGYLGARKIIDSLSGEEKETAKQNIGILTWIGFSRPGHKTMHSTYVFFLRRIQF